MKKIPSSTKSAKKSTWGGARSGAGRPTDENLSEQINLRVTYGQHTEYLRRGGAKWLRKNLSED